MKILSWRGETLSQAEADKLAQTFLDSARIGIEIEGMARFSDGRNSCGNSPRDCGICNSCAACDPCTGSNDYTHCRMNGTRSCRRRGGEANCGEGDAECQPCEFCNRCDSCDPCAACTDRAVGTQDQVFKKIAEEVGGGCTIGKANGPLSDKELAKRGDFIYIYHDGSVNVELVTNALLPARFEEVLVKAVEILSKYKVKMNPDQRAGGHQTICFSEHFPHMVAANVAQIMRYYLPALITIGCIEGTQTRGAQHRSLPASPGWSKRSKVFNQKYEAVHVKSTLALAGSPKMLEFRYPDSHTNVKQIAATGVINLAMCLKAIKMSPQGIASFVNLHWNKVESLMASLYRCGLTDKSAVDHKILVEMRKEMLEFLSPEIDDLLKNGNKFIADISAWEIPVKPEHTKNLVIVYK